MAALALIGAPQPWPPPPTPTLSSNPNKKIYNFCNIQPICSINCPQFCYNLFLPPPPPLFQQSSNYPSSSSSIHISAILAAIIASLSAAFLVLFYFAVVSPLLHRRRRRQIRHQPDDPARPESGLDESLIREITIFKYRRAEGLIDGTDCAVCLNEFKEEENLRLMPNCEHAFHIPCIDTWLKSHSSCPLCRATMDPLPARPASNPNTNTASSGAVRVAAMQIQSSNDVVLVVREVDGGDGEVVVVCHEAEEGEEEERESGEAEVRRKGDVNQR